MCNSVFADYVFPAYVGAESDVVVITPSRFVNQLQIAPIAGKAEIKQGTVKQDGWLYGIRGNYNIVSVNALYLGGEIGYKFGDLKGKVKVDEPIFLVRDPVTDEIIIKDKTKAKYSDLWMEVRTGFTFGGMGMPGGYLTPYFVVGYEKEKNDYVSPSPLELKHTLSYGYLGCGVISDFALSPVMSVGLNAKFKWMFKAKTKTGGEEWLEDKNISNANHFHWTIEVPVTYLIAENMSVSIAPFYEFKNYDLHKFEWLGKEKAKFHMWGGLFHLGYWF